MTGESRYRENEVEIFTQCCGDDFLITAYCAAREGVWSRAELRTAETAGQQPSETRGDFKRRVRCLRGSTL